MKNEKWKMENAGERKAAALTRSRGSRAECKMKAAYVSGALPMRRARPAYPAFILHS
jgi:hypothetical protein